MELNELNDHFGIPGVLVFHTAPGGLLYVAITTPHASATVYLQGAHITAWQPAGHQPVLFTSRRTELVRGKAIRGGVPLVFPWFGARHDGGSGPSHGFARIQDWKVAFAALAGQDLHLTLTLAPTELSRSLGFDNFRLAYQLVIGPTLTLELTVANDASEPLVFEEAMHTYYAVADAGKATVTGLDDVPYLDKVENFSRKLQHGPVLFSGPTDRVYLSTAATCVLHDPAGNRKLTVAKTGSNTTVVWNPWDTGAAKLPDMDPGEWREFVAVETANAAEDAVTLPPGATHTMQTKILLDEFES